MNRLTRLRFGLGLVLAAGAGEMRAVILADLDGTQNTTAPTDDPGWANVGSTGVYLGAFGGGYWVLTAAHVGPTTITLSTGTFTPVANSGVNVRNPDNSTSDLLLYRLSADPGLPSLTLASSAPANGSAVTTIGAGRNRDAGLSYWSVDTNGNPSGNQSGNAWIWTSLPNATGATASGYAWAAGSTLRHGTNQIDGSTVYNIGTGDTTAFTATFDAVSGDSQGATGDSGGAVFYKNGSTWELVGIMGAIGTYNNQPSGTAVFGNTTLYASVPAYYSTIVSAIPEPAEAGLWLGGLAACFCAWRRRYQRQ